MHVGGHRALWKGCIRFLSQQPGRQGLAPVAHKALLLPNHEPRKLEKKFFK